MWYVGEARCSVGIKFVIKMGVIGILNRVRRGGAGVGTISENVKYLKLDELYRQVPLPATCLCTCKYSNNTGNSLAGADPGGVRWVRTNPLFCPGFY